MCEHNPYPRVWKEGKNAYEHRLEAEKRLGRPLQPGEVVHHETEDKADHSHLKVFSSQAEHMRYHHLKRKVDGGMVPLLPIELLER